MNFGWFLLVLVSFDMINGGFLMKIYKEFRMVKGIVFRLFKRGANGDFFVEEQMYPLQPSGGEKTNICL